MVGETLEQHCENEFNKLRSTAFPTAFLIKTMTQNEAKALHLELHASGTEIISIMFEMKNEMDTTSTKK